jgi:hypothetical protein
VRALCSCYWGRRPAAALAGHLAAAVALLPGGLRPSGERRRCAGRRSRRSFGGGQAWGVAWPSEMSCAGAPPAGADPQRLDALARRLDAACQVLPGAVRPRLGHPAATGGGRGLRAGDHPGGRGVGGWGGVALTARVGPCTQLRGRQQLGALAWPGSWHRLPGTACTRGYPTHPPTHTHPPTRPQQDHIYQPYDDVVPYEEFSIRLSAQDVPRIKQLLEAVSPAEWRRLHEGLKKWWADGVWEEGLHPPALNCTANGPAASPARRCPACKAGQAGQECAALGRPLP